MKTALFFIIFATISGTAMAIENTTTTCTHDGQKRIIEVMYQGVEEVPCEVRYTKDTGTTTLWRAQVEFGYCEDNAAAFIAKLEGWGWQCNTNMYE